MKKTLLAIILLFTISCTCGCTLEITNDTPPVPDFTVYNAAGEEVKLSDFHGKPIILNFWASWCSPCKEEMPEFEKAYKKHGKDIHFLMVNITYGSGETVEKASSFIESKGYTFPVYFDTSGFAASTFNISSIPATFFIDKDGNVATYAVGAIDMTDLEKGIQIIT